jgi:hypothetical protein
MARAQEVWRVRVCGSDGAVYGAGVLVAGCSVLTCAHVVEHALGMDAERVRPGVEVDVDLPMSPQFARHRARIAASGWMPAGADRCGDLAVLTLPDGAVRGICPAVDLTVAARVGWMMPLENAARHWPPLATLLTPPDVPPGAFDDSAPEALRRSWLFGVVECCLRVPVLAGQDGRDRVVGQLRPSIAAVAERSSRPGMDLHGIVTACLAYEGGLAEFVEVVGGFEGGSLPMRDLRQAVGRIPRGAVA